MSAIINFPFTDSDNYTFDSDKIDILAGEAILKDLRPEGSLYYAAFSSVINTTWTALDGYNLTGVSVGGAIIENGFLNLKGGTVKYVDYATTPSSSPQVGCARAIIKPNYSGSPSVQQVFVIACKEANDSKNHIALYQKDDGLFSVQIRDKDGVVIVNEEIGPWSPVSGTEYEFEFNYDLDLGEHRLFINGVQFDGTLTGTGTRDSNVGLIRVGSSYTAASTANFEIKDLLVFGTVQHTANYTPGEAIPATPYYTDNPSIECDVDFITDLLEQFAETATKTGSDEIKYILSKAGTYYYHDGSSWVESDETYSKSNTAAEILLNIDDFTDYSTTVTVKVFLHSESGLTTPELDNIAITYSYGGAAKDTINKCIVWGYNTGIEGDPDINPFYIYLSADTVQYKDNVIVKKEKVTITPDDVGYWEAELIENDNMEGDIYYIFVFTYENESGPFRTILNRVVPDQETANFNDLEEPT